MIAINITVPDNYDNIGGNIYIDQFNAPLVDRTGYFGIIMTLDPYDPPLYFITGYITKNVTDDLIVYICLLYILLISYVTVGKRCGS